MKSFKIILPLLFIIFVSCKKDHGVLGVDVQPAVDSLNSEFVEYPVYAYTQKYDSIASWNDRYKYLGSNNDPHFGKVDIGLYLNANTNETALTFTASPVIDSSEIILEVDNLQSAGDITASLTYSVYPLDSTLSTKRVYFTTNTGLHNAVPIGPAFTAKASLLNGKHVVRIRIDTNHVKKILKDGVTNNTDFQALYKGFYIVASAGTSEGIIYKVDTESDESGLFLYYKNKSDTTKRSLKFTFKGSSSVKFNTMKFDYGTGPYNLSGQLGGDTTLGRYNLYLKGMGVTRLKILIPALKIQSDSVNIAVNRAELILNVDVNPLFDNGSAKYAVPPTLALLPIGADGRDTFALDQLNLTDNTRYDGVYDAANKRYVFNIARHVQGIYKGEKGNHGFHVVVADPSKLKVALRDIFIQRVILAGTEDPVLKPRFKVSYIRFKEDH